jgi:hypothetical protein
VTSGVLIGNKLLGRGPGVELGAAGPEGEGHNPRAIPRGPHGSIEVEADGAGAGGGLELGSVALEADLHKPRASP